MCVWNVGRKSHQFSSAENVSVHYARGRRGARLGDARALTCYCSFTLDNLIIMIIIVIKCGNNQAVT